MIITISKSNRKNKKFQAKMGDKTIHFGDSRYEDYTINKDPSRRTLYINRHKKNEDWSKKNIFSPAWMSRYILWEKPTIPDAIKNANNMYNDIEINFN